MIDDANLPPHDEPEREEKGPGLSDSLRKAVVSGVSALFMTEEGIRGALSDLRLPKEALSYLAQQTDRTRKELFGAVTNEVKGFLQGVDLGGALRKALTGLKLQVKAEIRFVDAQASESTVSVNVQPTKPRGRRKRNLENR